MKVSKEKAALNHERILTEAARLFRERGLSGVGVDALADAAGLTHGSLYSQFGSKERLAEEALNHAAAGSAEQFERIGGLEEYVDHYLSASHRESRGEGCAIAALGSEMPRQGAPLRSSFSRAVRAMVARVASRLPETKRREDEALAIAATMVGALILARGVDDPKLSDRILAASAARLRGR